MVYRSRRKCPAFAVGGRSRWDVNTDIVVNIPKQAAIQGYDIKGRGMVFGVNGNDLDVIEFTPSFRH